MAGRKYTAPRVVSKKTGKVSKRKTNILNANNATSRVISQNDNLGVTRGSPLNLVGRGVNQMFNATGSKRRSRVHRQTLSAEATKRGRK